MDHEKLTNKLSTNEKRARLAVEGTNLYPEISLLGFELWLWQLGVTQWPLPRNMCESQRSLSGFKIHQTTFSLITRMYLKNKQEQTVNTRNKSFQEFESTHLDKKK